MQQRGKFLTVEGIDGSGKTTAINTLATRIRELGFDVLLLREPGGTAIGERIRSILLDKANTEMTATCELFLFAAARAELTETVIKPALESGQVVICDRFIDSTIAYQGFGRGIDAEQIRQMNDTATGGLRPDRTFLLDLDTEAAAKRMAGRAEKPGDRLDLEGLNFQAKVREGYLQLAENEPARIHRLDADRNTYELVDQMLMILREDWQL